MQLTEENLTKRKYNNKTQSTGSIIITYLYVILWGISLFLLPQAHRGTGLFYITVITSAVVFAFLAQRSKSLIMFNFNLFISFLILFFILGFRNISGIDDPNYSRIFYEVNTIGWVEEFKISTMEPGYLILNRVVGLFTNEYIYMQILTSFIPLSIFYASFKKYKNFIDIAFAVFLLATTIYFQILSTALVRMFIAVSIIFRALYYIPFKDTKKFIFHVFIASIFHYSALFMSILIYFTIDNKKLGKKAKRFVVVAFLLTPVIFITISSYLVPLLGARYSGYGTIGSFIPSIWDFSTIPLLLVLLYFYRKKEGITHGYFLVGMSLLTMTSVLSIYGNLVSFGRLIFYTNCSLFLVAPIVGQSIKGSNVKRILFYAIVIAYCIFYLYRTQFLLEHHIPNLFPYENVFFRM
jgi:hypothetical protein